MIEKAASGLETLKMADSPVKNLNFSLENKENISQDHVLPPAKEVDVELKKPITELVKKDEKVAVAPSIKLEEVDEPLLQENPNRFVLFPIKYHEVRVDALRVY